jgi:hypothetical protein
LPAACKRRCSGRDLSIVSPSDEPPQPGDAGQNDPKHHDDERNLEPDKAPDLAKYEFDPRSPRRRNIIADKLHAALYRPLKARQQFRLLVEGRCNHQPSQYDGQRTKRVDLGVVPDTREAIIDQCSSRHSRGLAQSPRDAIRKLIKQLESSPDRLQDDAKKTGKKIRNPQKESRLVEVGD